MNALRQRRNVVSCIEAIDDFRYVVKRPGKSTIRVYLTNKYVLSVADLMEILEEAPETTCIVATMGDNQWSPEAEQHCRELRVGLLKTSELLGAVYYDGNKFLDYVPPDKRR